MKNYCLFRRYDADLLILSAISSGLLFRYGTGLQPIWYLAWLAPVPLFLFARSSSAEKTYLAGLLAALIWESGNLTYLLGVLGPQRTGAVIAAKALLWPLVILAARRSLWSYPFLCVALEVATELTSSHGSFNSLAYSQMEFLPAIQIASVLGPGGVTFLVALFGSAVAQLLIHRRPFELLAILPVALSLIWGTWRITSAPETPTIKVGLVGSGNPSPDTLLPLIDRLASRGARIVVLPEKLLDGKPSSLEPFLLSVKPLRLFLVVGINFEGKENQAVLLGPEGELARYRKAHLVPGWENTFTPGHAITLQQLPSALVGVAICKDMDFPQWGRRYGEAGIQIMLVPAADFPGDAWLHSRISVLRGVENGFSVARAALDGNLTLSDRYGRVIAEAPSREEVLAADVPLGSPTLFTEIGNTFGFACALIFLASFLPRGRMVTRRA